MRAIEIEVLSGQLPNLLAEFVQAIRQFSAVLFEHSAIYQRALTFDQREYAHTAGPRVFAAPAGLQQQVQQQQSRKQKHRHKQQQQLLQQKPRQEQEQNEHQPEHLPEELRPVYECKEVVVKINKIKLTAKEMQADLSTEGLPIEEEQEHQLEEQQHQLSSTEIEGRCRKDDKIEGITESLGPINMEFYFMVACVAALILVVVIQASCIIKMSGRNTALKKVKW